MKLVVQRVKHANVSVNDEIIGTINNGLCILVGIKNDDNLTVVKKLAQKVAKLRIFSDTEGKMNLSVKDIKGSILSVSQFTLYANTSQGNRPGFGMAARPDTAKDFYDAFNSQLRSEGLEVQTGKFGADMKLDLSNDGPVTIVMEINSDEI